MHNLKAAQNVFSNHWEPFVSRFSGIDNGLEKFLFPYGLILKSTVTKADLFSQIRTVWLGLQHEQIITAMERYVPAFLAVEAGQKDPDSGEELNNGVNRIHRLGKPSSTYAFILRLVSAVRAEEIPENVAVEILGVIEDFLFRRAPCGVEPTGLHAVFKGLWGELTESSAETPDPPDVSAQSVREAISGRATVTWPDDIAFEEAIRTGNLYARKAADFALREYESSRPGESPIDGFQKEHICPKTPTPEWESVFGESYDSLVNTWANLVPLTERMNPALGQKSYAVKKCEYEGSVFACARELADNYEEWTPENVNARADELVTWALERWPTTRSTAT
jgi:hypothetical protein